MHERGNRLHLDRPTAAACWAGSPAIAATASVPRAHHAVKLRSLASSARAQATNASRSSGGKKLASNALSRMSSMAGGPDAGRSSSFTRVRGAVKASRSRPIEPRLERLRRIAQLSAGQPKCDHSVLTPLDRGVGDEVRQRQVRVQPDGAAWNIEDPAQVHAELPSDQLATARQATEERLARPAIHFGSRSERHFSVPDVLRGKLAPELIRHELEVLGLDQAASQDRVHLDKMREIAELEPGAQAVQVLGRQCDTMPPRELEQCHGPDRALEVHVQLRLGRSRDVLQRTQRLTIRGWIK